MSNEVNPFYHSGPVVGEGFVNRNEELDTLLRWLGTKPPSCVAIYGPERIGKTSLLRQLCEVAGPQQYPDYQWVYLDLQGIFSPGEFWATLTQQLKAPDQDIRAALHQARTPVVLCLDEFGKVLSRSEFTADFYDLLRSLTQTGRLALVISTLRPPKELSVPSQADVSRFFNIFRSFRLDSFSDEAARELLQKGLADRDDVEWILKNVREHNHPYHLQLLGACLWEAKRSGHTRKEALEHYQQALEWEKPPFVAQPLRLSSWEMAGMVAMTLAIILLVIQIFVLHPVLLAIAGVSFTGALIFWLIDRFRRGG